MSLLASSRHPFKVKSADAKSGDREKIGVTRDLKNMQNSGLVAEQFA